MEQRFDEERHIDREVVERMLERGDIGSVSISELFELFRQDNGISSHAPDALCQLDPRDGALVIYNSRRAHRPHDNVNEEQKENGGAAKSGKSCPICEGKTTGVVDFAELSRGFTFINKNLFPILFPPETVEEEWLRQPLYPDYNHQGRVSYGLHFLQWTSSYHNDDWDTIPPEDRRVVLERLAALEKRLLFGSEQHMPPSSQWESQKETSGFVTVIKNYGAPVGGSLEHGHQQIGWNNIMPRSYYNNWCFYNRHDMYFSEYMLRENPTELTIKEYGYARLIVPYFMKRPYNMLLLFHDVGKQYLCELDPEELDSLGDALHEATRMFNEVMPRVGKEVAYNVVFHNGPGAGFYVEFLPYTQETGGFEHLGLWVCQSLPEIAAENLKILWPQVLGED